MNDSVITAIILQALCFVRPDARLAGFNDVRDNWNYYSRQVPPGYNPLYKYEDARYTNWTRIPLVSPAARSVLSFFIGHRQADTFSMRTLFMNAYQVYLYALVVLYIPLLLITIRALVKTKILPDRDTLVTARNVFKYLRLRLQATYDTH